MTAFEPAELPVTWKLYIHRTIWKNDSHSNSHFHRKILKFYSHTYSHLSSVTCIHMTFLKNISHSNSPILPVIGKLCIHRKGAETGVWTGQRAVRKSNKIHTGGE